MSSKRQFFQQTYCVHGPMLLVTVIPIVLWGMTIQVRSVFTSVGTFMTTVGQVLGLFGVSLFAFNLILSARLRWLETLFGGLNRLYIQHSRYGQIAFMALLFHPLFLAVQYSAGSFLGATKFLLPSDNLAMDFGIVALGLMFGLITLTLYLRPKYSIWKWTHKFFGFAFFLAYFHVLLIPSTVTTALLLRYYILGLAGLGLIAFLYRAVFGRFFVKRSHYTIQSVEQLNDTVTRIVMKPVKVKLQYKPGQFIFVHFKDRRVGMEAHPFSIVSGPENANLEIAVKNLGDYTENVPQLSVGAQAFIEGPFGTFVYQTGQWSTQIWIAGGIGITPFVSMARSLMNHSEYRIDLYYAVKNKQEAVYDNVFRELEQSLNGRFKVIIFYSDTQGRMNAEFIAATSGGVKGKEIFLCAPPVMIKALKQQFLKQGVPTHFLHSEEFNF